MKPDWDALAEQFASSSSVLVADVDCTEQNDLCSDHGVRGYPTIKYYTQETGKEGAAYNGGRDLESLTTFVEENLELKCDVASLPGKCTEKELAYIEKMKAAGAADQKKALERLEGMAGNSMKAELKVWLGQRINILKQLTE
mmetsp:Transcript_1560/g.5341  ORF Transcript_1560/g.5341 Transcript_1560/m.5341 type:complete len:142 (+) Transcript_1560:213-638(+)